MALGAKTSRALLVRRGSPPNASVVALSQRDPADGEVVVHVQAAALTPTDALLCSASQSLVSELVPLPSTAAFVPGCFFYGEVLALGAFVEGLEIGEFVIGIADGAASTGVNMDGNADTEDPNGCGGCYREHVCVHFSALVPVPKLMASGFHMPSVIAHLPPMISALSCVASHLRLREGETLLVIAPRLADVVFLLQRLLLIGDAWQGPLYLLLLQGHAPSRGELERHPLLKPALGHSVGDGIKRRPSFLDDLICMSVEDHVQQRAGGSVRPEQVADALKELVTRVLGSTQGVGVDVILALDVDLSPEMLRSPEPAVRTADGGERSPVALTVAEMPPRPATLLRSLVGALALRGRLVTNCRELEMTPADGEHLWIIEGSMSFLNPHCAILSAARHGSLLHAMMEVFGRIANAELAVAESEVAQYRLFEQFHHAYEASVGRSSRGAGPQLVVLMV